MEQARRRVRTATLLSTLAFVGVLAACAPVLSPGVTSPAVSPPLTMHGTAPEARSPTPGTAASAASVIAPGGLAQKPTGASGPLPHATAFSADLQALGLDPASLPPLNKLEGDTLRKVMKTFAKSLGAKCADCHADDFAAPTRNKAIAARMWDHFVRDLTLPSGEALYCDSCHAGRLKFLDRTDRASLEHWMSAAFVTLVQRVESGAPAQPEHGLQCSTCHGEPFVGTFLAAWSQKKPVRGASIGPETPHR